MRAHGIGLAKHRASTETMLADALWTCGIMSVHGEPFTEVIRPCFEHGTTSVIDFTDGDQE